LRGIRLDPGVVRQDGHLSAWWVTARGPDPKRGKAPKTVSGRGEDEAAALRDPDAVLRGDKPGPGSRLDEIRQRLRLEYLAGAEEWTREHIGRPMTEAELAGERGYRMPGSTTCGTPWPRCSSLRARR
jgi:hypothetical protein